MRFVTRSDVYVGFRGERCIFGSGSRQKSFTNPSFYLPLLHAAAAWKVPHTTDEIKSKLVTLGMDVENIEAALDYLMQSKYVGVCSDQPDDRYARHLLYYSSWDPNPGPIQERIKASSVAILGCGGIGNHVSGHLASAGVGKLVLIDGDTVELSNLTRQTMFTEQDVGRLKVDVLANRLSSINSEIHIDTVDMLVRSVHCLDKIPSVDVVVVSADEPGDIMNLCNTGLYKRNIAYLNAGYIGDIAVFGPFVVPGQTSCFACNQVIPDSAGPNPESNKLAAAINSHYKAPSFGPVNGIAAAMAALDVLRYLGNTEPHSTNRRIGIHSASMKIEYQDYKRNGQCIVCASS